MRVQRVDSQLHPDDAGAGTQGQQVGYEVNVRIDTAFGDAATGGKQDVARRAGGGQGFTDHDNIATRANINDVIEVTVAVQIFLRGIGSRSQIYTGVGVTHNDVATRSDIEFVEAAVGSQHHVDQFDATFGIDHQVAVADSNISQHQAARQRCTGSGLVL